MLASTHWWYCSCWCHLIGVEENQKHFLISKDDVSIYSSVIFKLIMSSQRGEMKTFSIQPFWTFCARIYKFPIDFFGYGSKSKIWAFVLGCTQYIHGNKPRSKNNSDKMKKNTIIVLKKKLILVVTPTPLSTFPLVCMLCVFPYVNIIIDYTKVSRISEGNRGLSTQWPFTYTSKKPLVSDLI